MEDLGTLGKMLPRIPPPGKKLELPKEDLGISGKSLPRIPPPQVELLMEDFVQGTGVWRLIASSPKDIA